MPLERLGRNLEQPVKARPQHRGRIWNVLEDLLVIIDAQGNYISVNSAWTTVLGWSEAELLGHNPEWLIHPDDRKKTVSQLNQLAAFGEGRREKLSVKVNDLICDVLTLVHAELERQHIALQMELSDGVFEIIADRIQLQQVLLNLFNNALEAMSSVTGRPRVLSVKSQTLEPSDIAILSRRFRCGY